MHPKMHPKMHNYYGTYNVTMVRMDSSFVYCTSFYSAAERRHVTPYVVNVVLVLEGSIAKYKFVSH